MVSEEPEEIIPVTAAIPAAPAEPTLPSFRNPIAVRVAFTVSLVTLTATLLIRGIIILDLLLWVAAGFFAVVFYRKRTGQFLNVRGGLRMGWMTGVLMFALTAVIFAGSMIALQASGGVASMFQSQIKNSADPNVQAALRMLDSSAGLAVILIMTIFMLFVFITALSMAGGALGAKMKGRQ